MAALVEHPERYSNTKPVRVAAFLKRDMENVPESVFQRLRDVLNSNTIGWMVGDEWHNQLHALGYTSCPKSAEELLTEVIDNVCRNWDPEID